MDKKESVFLRLKQIYFLNNKLLTKIKTKLFKVTLCVVTFAIATIVWVKAQSTQRFSDIQLANIEAFANNESGTQTCTRIVSWVNCYDRNGNWSGMSITAIETT